MEVAQLVVVMGIVSGSTGWPPKGRVNAGEENTLVKMGSYSLFAPDISNRGSLGMRDFWNSPSSLISSYETLSEMGKAGSSLDVEKRNQALALPVD